MTLSERKKSLRSLILVFQESNLTPVRVNSNFSLVIYFIHSITSVHVSIPISQLTPPPHSWCPQVCSLYLCLYFCFYEDISQARLGSTLTASSHITCIAPLNVSSPNTAQYLAHLPNVPLTNTPPWPSRFSPTNAINTKTGHSVLCFPGSQRVPHKTSIPKTPLIYQSISI